MLGLTVLIQVHDHILFGPDGTIELVGREVLEIALLRINLIVLDHA